MFCRVLVEAKEEVNGNVADIVNKTVDWLQNYFSNGITENLPTICVLSDSTLGKYRYILLPISP